MHHRLQPGTSRWSEFRVLNPPAVPLHLLVVLLSLLIPVPLGAQPADSTAAPPPSEPRRIPPLEARRINPHPLHLDGRLDDAAWEHAAWVGGFQQKDPVEGAATTRETEVALLYDDDVLYVGARMKSPDPARDIRATVSRRDNAGNSERIIVSLDTYHDRRTAYSFAVTATGVRADYYHPSDNEGDRDYSWDPVWHAHTRITTDGWTAEMAIPFSQLRFRNEESQTWGINFNHWIPSLTEDAYLVYIPKNATGWSSHFPELTGLTGIRPKRRLELLPYVAGNGVFTGETVPGDPFHDGSDFDARAGGDLKMGIGPNLTLDATVNPDFGQVEADPAEVNLSAFETFFDEKRPFFTEGSQLLRGGGPSYFYSRRIGAPPRGGTPEVFVRRGDKDNGGDTLTVDFSDRPQNTTILGAAKLTGSLNSGLSVGALTALTGRENARLMNAATGARDRARIEPLSGFGVVRLQQQFGAHGSTAGLSLTGVRRDLPEGDPLAARFNREAFTGGADWSLRFQGGRYQMTGYVGFSHIAGDSQAIARAQLGPQRYYQRPDIDYIRFDPSRTSLSGYTGGFRLRKASGAHWLGEIGGGAESPGFELNDAGRLSTSDDLDAWANLQYRETEPGRFFRNWSIDAWANDGWNYGGDRQYTTFDLYFNGQLRNFMNLSVTGNAWLPNQNDGLSRGGPSMETSGGRSGSLFWNTNFAANVYYEQSAYYSRNDTGGYGYGTDLSVRLRTGGRWEVSLSPGYSREQAQRQYITTRARPSGDGRTYGQRYIFSAIDRSTLSTRLRLNYSFTPDLSLELYAEPFAASGRYFKFGEMSAPRARKLRKYGEDGTTIQRTETPDGTEVYQVTDGGDAFELVQPDFNVLSFNSNVVLRWEWHPGSALFLVWQQSRGGFEPSGELIGPRQLFDSFSAGGDSFIAAKVTYWIPVN